MGDLGLRAEYWLKLAGHYSEPVRLMLFFYKAFRWLIRLPGRMLSAYRDVQDFFRFLRDLPQRMVEGLVRAVVVAGLFTIAGAALSALAAKLVRPVVIVGLVAIVGTALYVAAKGSARVAA